MTISCYNTINKYADADHCANGVINRTGDDKIYDEIYTADMHDKVYI